MSKRHTPRTTDHLSTPVDHIFRDYDRVEPLALDVERDLIRSAQRGNRRAAEALIEAYAPALRSAVASFARTIYQTPISVESDDLEQTAMIALYEEILRFDLDVEGRLARVVKHAVRNALVDEQAAASMIPVPSSTLRRFLGFVREANGDFALAREIGATKALRPETFDRILDAVRNTVSLEGYTSATETELDEIEATSIFASAEIDEDAVLMADVALGAMDERQTRVVRLSYGFDESEPLPDAEIAHRLGSSRSAVQRVRSAALDVAREALGVEA